MVTLLHFLVYIIYCYLPYMEAKPIKPQTLKLCFNLEAECVQYEDERGKLIN